VPWPSCRELSFSIYRRWRRVAKNLVRPGMSAARSGERTKGDAVIIAKLDRLTRSVKTCVVCWSFLKSETCAHLGGRVARYGSAAGRGHHHYGRGERMERLTIGERTKAAMQYMKSNGDCVGNIAYGYRRRLMASTWNPTRKSKRC